MSVWRGGSSCERDGDDEPKRRSNLMGYNLQLACHTCMVKTGVLRGEEARAIKRFGSEHPGDLHDREARVDNGWSNPDEFPEDYKEIEL